MPQPITVPGEVVHTGPKHLPELGVVFPAGVVSAAGGVATESAVRIDSPPDDPDIICTD